MHPKGEERASNLLFPTPQSLLVPYQDLPTLSPVQEFLAWRYPPGLKNVPSILHKRIRDQFVDPVKMMLQP